MSVISTLPEGGLHLEIYRAAFSVVEISENCGNRRSQR